MTKKFILNADDFGMSQAFNRAVLKGYQNGILTSASICANGEAFESAISEVIPQCPDLSIGVHLNIIEGKSLTNVSLLTDENGIFNNGYGAMILKSCNNEFLRQVEQEFRAQIEKIMAMTKVDHIDSHVHTHAIPNIFKIVVKLAKEYNIPYIRTQFEYPYLIPSIKKYLTIAYPINLIKIILLNTFTMINSNLVKENNLKTNDYLIGVGYTGMMDDKSIAYGLNALKNKDCIAEALIHPCDYDSDIKDHHTTEFELTQNEDLRDFIKEIGFELSNHTNAFL